MKRSPSYNNLGESNGAGLGGLERAVHHDLHFDAGVAGGSNATRPWPPPSSSQAYYQGQWQASSPPPPVQQQSTRPSPPQIPPQWNQPVPTNNTRLELGNNTQWDDYLDMPEPSAMSSISAPQLPPRKDTQSTYWNVPSTNSGF